MDLTHTLDSVSASLLRNALFVIFLGVDNSNNFARRQPFPKTLPDFSHENLNYINRFRNSVLFRFTRLLCDPVNHDPSFNLEYRGPVVMKGKPEPMECWFLTRKATPVAK